MTVGRVLFARPNFLAAALCLAATGCGGGGSDGAGGTASSAPAKFSAIYPLIFPPKTTARCEFCHSLPANEVSNGKLHVGSDQETAYQALFGQTSVSTRCTGKTLVVPNEPDKSLFLQKLLPSPPCGNRMPLGGAVLSDDVLEMVRSWIAAGAKDD